MSRETTQWLNQNVLVGMATQRGNAWHYRRSDQGLEPNHYPGAIPIADVRRRLFSWHAVEVPVAIEAPSDVEHMSALNNKGEPIRYIVQPNRKAIAADDNYDVLGMFRPGYQPHQYDKWLLETVANILDDDLSISSAGLLRNRAVAWVEVGVPENVTTKEGVIFRPNLLAATSFDGSLATTFKRTITACVCDNTMSIALSESGGQTKFRHSRNSIARISDARIALDIVHKTADEFAKQVEALCATTVTDAQWSKFLESVVPIDDTSKRSKTIGEHKRHELTHLYRADDRVAPWTKTAFGVVQAVNTWELHHKPTKGGTIRAERNMMAALDGTIEHSDLHTLQALASVGVLEMSGGQSLAAARPFTAAV